MGDKNYQKAVESFLESCDWYDKHAHLSQRERIEKLHDTGKLTDLEYQEFVGMTMWRGEGNVEA